MDGVRLGVGGVKLGVGGVKLGVGGVRLGVGGVFGRITLGVSIHIDHVLVNDSL